MWDFAIGVLSNWVADALGAAITGGVVIGWIKLRHPTWIPTVCFGLGGAVVILIGAGTLRLVAWPLPSPSGVTMNNVEEYSRRWLDKYNYATRVREDKESIFALDATAPSGFSVTIRRSRSLDRYLLFSSIVTIDDHTMSLFSKDTIDHLTHQLRIELARQKISFLVDNPPRQIGLTEKLAITPQLSEDQFTAALDDLDFAGRIVSETVLQFFSKAKTQGK
jgi:hypothetical protein